MPTAGMPSASMPSPAMPTSGPLVDRFGRIADDLRISVTDRCNFRCTYCMPLEGLAWLPKHELLSFEELTRALAVFVGLGVRSLKVTGGEPLVRADLPVLIRMFREVGPELDISLTTNGVLLDRLASPLAEAGVDRATISCDSLLRHRFEEMTRRDALDRVLAGMRAAEAAGLTPIKVNCVVIGGTNDDEVVDFARWSRETGYEVRFIEYMPLDAQHAWEREKVVPAARILEAIDAVFPLRPEGHANEPATTYRFADGEPGRIGVIPSVTEPFCDTCNRLRLTAEGMVRTCLFALDETDVRAPMRSGASDRELEHVIRSAVWTKWSGHRINHPDFVQPARSMSMIGG
jgi:cyclic pyranopterin phosphate synthase